MISEVKSLVPQDLSLIPKKEIINPMRKLILTILIGLQATLTSVDAQNFYPVYVTPTLTPPYSLKLSDYSKFGSQHLVVNITVNDMQIANMPVKLRIKMETAGVTVENLPTINTAPIYLDGGSNHIVFGKELEDYFNIKNLVFKGYSKEAYSRTGQLPEGFYQFTVEVLHFQTNKRISNAGTATAWIALGKPPVLKTPLDGADMGEFKGMPIVFSWLASNVGTPISAGSIQYKFEMWEMRIDGISPYSVATSMPVFYEATTFNTMHSFYPATTMMEPGMKYAWRVTASDASGFVPFEQDGHSEIRTFTYKSKCGPVENLTAKNVGSTGTFSWEPQDNHTSFNVEMRQPVSGWTSASETYDSKATFYELTGNTTYEMRVQAVCNGDPQSVSDHSEWTSLTIPRKKPIIDTSSCPDCKCEENTNSGEINNFELRGDLKPGDTLLNRFGKTRYIVKTAEPQGNGMYKGIFLYWAEIWNIKFICEYWDLSVNTDDVIVNMDFESVYDPQFVLDVDSTVNYFTGLANTFDSLNTWEIKDTLKINEPITSVYVNGGDSVIAVTLDENGNVTEKVIAPNTNNLEKVLLEGKDGEKYVVTKYGGIMGVDEYKKTGGNENKIDDYNREKEKGQLSETVKVDFKASEAQQYGFDSYTADKTFLQQHYRALDNGYRPAWKSISSFATDKVAVSNANKTISFRDEMGIPALVKGNELVIRGAYDGAETALYAYQAVNDTTEKIVGKLNIASYDEEIKKVYLVPVNAPIKASEAELEKVLNRIYSQAVVKWKVEKLGKITVTNFENGEMTHGGSSRTTAYNNDQKETVRVFRENNELEQGAYYLFFINNVQGKQGDIAGYMPFQRQVGFIYDNPNLEVIAHELGHGAFNLKHTFSKEEFIAPEMATQNLMDYKGGTELWKHQWDLVQSPKKMLFAWSKDEEESAMMDRVATIIKAMQEANVNTPGSIIELPWYGGASAMEGKVTIGNDEIDCEIIPKSKDYINGNKIKYTVPDFREYFAMPGSSNKNYYSCNGYEISFEQFKIKVKPPIIRIYDYDYLKEQTFKVRNYINNNASVPDIDYAALVKKYNNRYISAASQDDKRSVVKEFLEEDIYSKYYAGLSVDLRVAAIKGVMDIRHLYININDKEEQEILFLLNNINDEDISEFLEELETEQYNNKSLAINMLNDFQDAVSVAEAFGTQRDYYTSLLQVFIKLSVKDQTRIDALANYEPTQTIKLNIAPWWQQAKVKDFNYKLEQKNNQIILQEECYLPTGEKVQRINSQGLPVAGVYDYVYEWIESNSSQAYSPFDLVVLDDRSNLNSSILERIYAGETVLDGLKVLPAAAMHYIKKKNRNQTIEGLSYITVDLLAMAVGVGELALAGKVISNSRKVVVVIDVMNSAANIAVNTTDLQNDETIVKWLIMYNMGTMFANLSSMYRGTRNIANVGAKVDGAWKTFLDDDFVKAIRNEVLSNDELIKKYPNLSLDELTAIKVYTSDEKRNGEFIYKALNTELRAGKLSDFNKGLNDLINKGLSKLTPYNGSKVYRGIYGDEADIAKKWKVGDDITFKDFKSSSVSDNVAESFMHSNGGDVVYEISNPKGYDICKISCIPGESEIVFKSGSLFKVKELSYLPRITESDPLIRIIKLELVK